MNQQRRTGWRPLVSILALGGVVAAGLPATASASAPAPASAPASTELSAPPAAEVRSAVDGARAAPAANGGAVSVTLITGDTVRYARLATGQAVVDSGADLADGTESIATFTDPAGGVFAIPDQAAPLIAAGVLDRQLFNVEYLVENGYADQHRDAIPVIVTYEPTDAAHPMVDGARTAQPDLSGRLDALPATAGAVGLSSVNAAATAVDKRAAHEFWQELVAPRRGARQSTAEQSTAEQSTAGAAAPSLTGGVAKVWLDAKVEAALDESVPQVGAPQAWDAGFDGTGASVAVLDTGYDPEHPDLAGRVTSAKSFIPGEDVADGHGHGTHVAATVGGSGAAADGDRAGVAPGADLLVGKVLSNDGTGTQSEVLAGMEWAVAQGADVVNMSLGAGASNGADPMSLAVDALSASSDTLFVISAGNDGPRTQTVGTPGAAASALTIAAVDKADQLADFSSRGPLIGSYALKPDIAGPGVDIVAARAQGTALGQPVDEHYTSLRGTSMAAPHVAGAAAILAQRYPDWDGEQIKAALMSAAAPTGDRPYEVGAGRVDVAAAAEQAVFTTTGSVDFGLREWPHDSGELSRTITYRNTGDQPVTLELSLDVAGSDGEPAPADLFTLGADTVTVPAGGTAGVAVLLTETRAVNGSFAGLVTATAGDSRVVSPVGAVLQEERFEVTARIVLPDEMAVGDPCDMLSMRAYDIVQAAVVGGGLRKVDGECTVDYQLPAGTYMVDMYVSPLRWTDTDGNDVSSWGFVPEFRVDGDMEVAVDLNDARRVRVETPAPTEVAGWEAGYSRTAADGTQWNLFTQQGFTSAMVGADRQLRVTSTEEVTVGSFELSYQTTRVSPLLEMTVSEPAELDLQPHYTAKGPLWRKLSGSGELALVDAGDGGEDDFAELDVRDKLVLIGAPGVVGRRDPSNGSAWLERVARAAQAGAAAVLAFSTDDAGLHGTGFVASQDVPAAVIRPQHGRQLRDLLQDQPVTVHYTGTPEPAEVYTTKVHYQQQVPEDPDELVRKLSRDQLAAVDVSYHTSDPETLWHGSRAALQPRHTLAKLGRTFQATAPTQRTELYGPIDDELLWIGEVQEWSDAHELRQAWGTFNVFDEPDGHHAAYGRSVVLPTVREPLVGDWSAGTAPVMCPACQQDGDVYLWPQVGDTAGGVDLGTHLFGPLVYPSRHEWEAVVEGQPVPVAPRPAVDPSGSLQVPLPSFTRPDPGSEVELSHYVEDPDYADPGSPARTSTQTSWTFRMPQQGSAEHSYKCAGATDSECLPLPLIFFDYDLSGLAMDNTAVAGHEFGFAVEPHYQQGAEGVITEVSAEVSFDDGATWQEAVVAGRGDGTYRVTVAHPALEDTTGAVAIRMQARDATGGSVRQEVTRAYGLSPDACPDGRDSATVVFGEQDSGVPNDHQGHGCTFLDRIWERAPFANHGRFMRAVVGLTRQWRDEGLLTRQETQAIVVAAARSDVGRGGGPPPRVR